MIKLFGDNVIDIVKVNTNHFDFICSEESEYINHRILDLIMRYD